MQHSQIKHSHPLDSMRLLTSRAMAASVLSLCPEAFLIEGNLTRFGFYYDVLMPHELNPEWILLLKDEMRKFIRENDAITWMEMVPFSASEYLKDKHQPFRAKKAMESSSQLLFVLNWGGFVDLCPFAGEKTSEDFKIFDYTYPYKIKYQHKERAITRFFGTVKDGVSKKWKEKEHVHVASTLQFFDFEKDPLEMPFEEPQQIFWHSKGVHLRQRLKQHWLESIEDAGFSPILSETADYHKQFPMRRAIAQIEECEFDEGNALFALFGEKHVTADTLHLFSSQESLEVDLVRCIDLIICFLGSLNLKYHISVSGPLLKKILQKKNISFEERKRKFHSFQMELIDMYANRFCASYITFESKRNCKEIPITLSLFGSLEMVIALLLEKSEGRLPFWLSPVMLRILTIGGEGKNIAEELRKDLRVMSVNTEVAHFEGALKNKIRETFEEKIPYIIVIGKKELACISHKLCSEMEQTVISDESNVFEGKVCKPFQENTLRSDGITDASVHTEICEKCRLEKRCFSLRHIDGKIAEDLSMGSLKKILLINLEKHLLE